MWFRAAHRNTAAPTVPIARQTTRARLSRSFPLPARWAGWTSPTEAFMEQLSIAILARIYHVDALTHPTARNAVWPQFPEGRLTLLYTSRIRSRFSTGIAVLAEIAGPTGAARPIGEDMPLNFLPSPRGSALSFTSPLSPRGRALTFVVSPLPFVGEGPGVKGRALSDSPHPDVPPSSNGISACRHGIPELLREGHARRLETRPFLSLSFVRVRDHRGAGLVLQGKWRPSFSPLSREGKGGKWTGRFPAGGGGRGEHGIAHSATHDSGRAHGRGRRI